MNVAALACGVINIKLRTLFYGYERVVPRVSTFVNTVNQRVSVQVEVLNAFNGYVQFVIVVSDIFQVTCELQILGVGLP